MGIRWARHVVLVGALAAASACGPRFETRGEIFERYRARIDALMLDATDAFKTAMADQRNGPVEGQPLPFAKGNNGWAGDTNIAIFSNDTLFLGTEPKTDLYFQSPLSRAHDAGASEVSLRANEPADDDFEPMLEEAVTTPYVGGYSIDEYIKPEILSGGEYKPGSVTIVIGIVDVANKTVVASCRVWASNSDTVEFTARDTSLAILHIEAQLAENIRKQAALCLSEQTKTELNFG